MLWCKEINHKFSMEKAEYLSNKTALQPLNHAKLFLLLRWTDFIAFPKWEMVQFIPQTAEVEGCYKNGCKLLYFLICLLSEGKQHYYVIQPWSKNKAQHSVTIQNMIRKQFHSLPFTQESNSTGAQDSRNTKHTNPTGCLLLLYLHPYTIPSFAFCLFLHVYLTSLCPWSLKRTSLCPWSLEDLPSVFILKPPQ
jgi:hypothetical protein